MNETTSNQTNTGSTDPRQQAQRQQKDARSEAASAGQEAARALEDARQETRRAAETVKAEAASMAEEVQTAATDAAARAKQEGRDFLHRQKDRAAEEVGHFEAAVRRAGETLRDEQDDNLADYADRAAGQLSRLRDYLQRQDLQDLLHDVENTARRRPEMLFGGLFVAGLATARFLKASSRRRSRSRRSAGARRGSGQRHLEYAGAPRTTSSGAIPYEARGLETQGGTGEFASASNPTRSHQS